MKSFTLSRSQQPTLRYAVWQPTQSRGSVIITPGYAEHIGRWEHVAGSWAEKGFAVAVYDLRGQGHSEGRRGHVEHFADFVADLAAIYEQLQARHGWYQFGAPILFGHSLGALISTVSALEQPQRLRALALASPFYGLALKPAAWKVWAGRRLSEWMPTFTQPSQVPASKLTHDRQRAALFDADPLRVTTVTARWFTETEGAQALVRSKFGSLQVPVYCRAAGDDHVADVNATRHLFERFPSAQRKLEVVDDRFHELHQETDWQLQMSLFEQQFETWC